MESENPNSYGKYAQFLHYQEGQEIVRRNIEVCLEVLRTFSSCVSSSDPKGEVRNLAKRKIIEHLTKLNIG